MSQRFVVVVKADCPTCQLIAPVLEALAPRETVALWTQDDPCLSRRPWGPTRCHAEGIFRSRR